MTLTDEKIAELREAFKGEMRLMLPSTARRLLDEVERARALLRRIEWNAGGEDGRRCPCCYGGDPSNRTNIVTGHDADCELAALLSGTIPAHLPPPK